MIRISALGVNVLVVSTQSALHFINRAEGYSSEEWKKFEMIGGMDLILSDDVVIMTSEYFHYDNGTC